MTASTLPAGRPWWAGITDAEMSLGCGGLEHRVRWADGRLTALDHPDVDRERALVALGGDRVPCLDLLDAWTAHADDLDLLVLASRGPSDRLVDPEPFEAVRHSGSYAAGRTQTLSNARRLPRRPGGWTMYLPSNSALAESDDGAHLTAARLANLPGGLTDRLVATVIATWTERIHAGDDRVAAATPTLRAALYGRVLATVHSADIRSGPLDVVMVDPQAPRSVTAADGRIRCQLPFSWLGDVWVKGFATVLGHLCLSVESAQRDRWQLLVVDRDLHGTRTMTINLAGE